MRTKFVENVQHANMTPLEEAEAYRKIRDNIINSDFYKNRKISSMERNNWGGMRSKGIQHSKFLYQIFIKI